MISISSDSEVHLRTVEAEHPEFGKYELKFRVFGDTRYHLEVDRSDFPTEDYGRRLQSIEDDGDYLLEDNTDINKVSIDEDKLQTDQHPIIT